MKKITITVFSILIILTLPAAGVICGGGDLSLYLDFPPVTGYVEHHPFSWIAFTVIWGFIILSTGPLVLHVIKNRSSAKRAITAGFFPWWGYAGICAGILLWIIAWTRLPLLHELQRWTFLPLWISYIITINAFCFKRRGVSLLTDRTGYFLILFPGSAAFWWIFEYLNRFTNNWYYSGSGELSSSGYFFEATLAFSTVLPAVMSTAEVIKTFPRLYSGMDSYIRINLNSPRLTAMIILLISGAGLFMTAIYPELFFPLLWISPVVIILSLQSVFRETGFLSSLNSGDWRAVVIYALAALFCGFFWEMWNIFSQAKWIYSIPYVHRFLIFEMPVPGYAGYLPFGIECAVVAGMLSKRGEEPWRMI